MPEGVEVRIFAEGVAAEITGYRLTSIRVLRGRYARRPPRGLAQFRRSLPATVTGVHNKGKFIWWEMEAGGSQWYLFNTLGMTGAWTLNDTDYSRVVFTFKRGDRVTKQLYLFDVRNFATLKFMKRPHNGLQDPLERKLRTLGDDMFSRGWTTAKFNQDLNRVRAKSIAAVLLGQKIVSGPGTYVISEALYRARIAPSRRVGSLSRAEIERVHDAIKYIAGVSYRAQMFTVRNLERDVRVENGYRFKVYDQDEDPNGNPVRRYALGDRGIRWVPAVQR